MPGSMPRGRPRRPRQELDRFGLWLLEEREKRGLTEQELADALLLSRQYLNQITNGLRPASVDFLERLAKVFNLSSDLVFLAAGQLAPDLIGFLQFHPELIAKIRKLCDHSGHRKE